MAQNITLLGASYTDVPAVELPKTGGGTATFTDTTPTTASASDVSQGKYFFTASGVLTLGTNQGGSGSVTQDQDGFIILPPDGGGSPSVGGLEYEEGTWTPNEDIARGTIHFLNTHTTAPSIVEITDTDTATAPATYSNISMIFYNVHTLHGDGFPYNTTSTYYGVVQYLYYSSSQSASGQRTYLATSTGSASSGTPGYWADNTAIYPYTVSTSRYWRAGRTYKWIAVWAPTT